MWLLVDRDGQRESGSCSAAIEQVDIVIAPIGTVRFAGFLIAQNNAAVTRTYISGKCLAVPGRQDIFSLSCPADRGRDRRGGPAAGKSNAGLTIALHPRCAQDEHQAY